MSLLHRKRILLAKTEAVYGVDITPVTTDAMVTRNLEIQILGEQIGLDHDIPSLGTTQALHVGTHIEVTFEVPFQASGAAGTAPAYNEILEACGVTGTNDPGVSEIYNPLTTNVVSVTLYVHLDGQKFIVTGARGTVGIQLTIGQIPVWVFRFIGLYNAPAAAADPVPDVSDFVNAEPVTSTNTAVGTIHAQACEIQSMEFQQNNELVYEDLWGTAAQAVTIVNRAPNASVVYRMHPLGTFNPFAIAQANTLGAIAFTHGLTAGKILTLNAAQAQIIGPTMSENNGVRYINADLRCNESAAGDTSFDYTMT